MQNPQIQVLMVAEKPSIALALAKVLGGGNAKKRYGVAKRSPIHEYMGLFMGEAACFKVTSTFGHIYSLDFGQSMKNWKKTQPQELFTAPVSKNSDKQAQIPDHLAKEAMGCHALVLWLDCDREGENICFEVMQNTMHLLESSRTWPGAYNSRVFRAKFSSLQQQEIRWAMQNLKSPNEDIAASVEARMEIDLRLGVAFSRFQTKYFRTHFGAQLSDLVRAVTYGPCQMPTLWFCVQRSCQISEFIPKPYWKLKVKLSVCLEDFEIAAEAACGELWDKAQGQHMVNKIKDERATVTSKETVTVVQKRPLPLNTVTLLKKCSEQAGLSPGDTLHVAEQLYLRGYLSYPRTETTKYPKHFNLKEVTEMLKVTHQPWSDYVWKVDSAKVGPRDDGVDYGDHPPITPVMLTTKDRCKKDPREWEVYRIVVEHYLASQAPDVSVKETEVKMKVGDFPIVAKSSRVQDKGAFSWCDVLSAKPPEDVGVVDLSTLDKDAMCMVDEAELNQNITKLPLQLTEAELLDLMEKHGIGTDASMAVHIMNICKRSYVKLDEKTRQLTPTGLGLALVHAYTLVDAGLVQPTVRAKIENACAKVATGKAWRKEVVDQAIAIYEKKFERFSARIDRLPVMLAMAYTKDKSKIKGAATNAVAQWDFSTKVTASVKLEHLMMGKNTADMTMDDTVNPELVAGMQVRISGLKAAPQLNDKLGVCETFDAAKGRWQVKLPNGEVKALKADNLQAAVMSINFWPGLPVKLHGLTDAESELNDKEGTCESWEAPSGRWKVKLAAGDVKAIKPDNLVEVETGKGAQQALAAVRAELEALGMPASAVAGGNDTDDSSWEQDWGQGGWTQEWEHNKWNPDDDVDPDQDWKNHQDDTSAKAEWKTVPPPHKTVPPPNKKEESGGGGSVISQLLQAKPVASSGQMDWKPTNSHKDQQDMEKKQQDEAAAKRKEYLAMKEAAKERAASGMDQDAGSKVIDAATERKLDEWVEAKRKRDFEVADKLRAELKAIGIDAAEERPAKGGKGKGKKDDKGGDWKKNDWDDNKDWKKDGGDWKKDDWKDKKEDWKKDDWKKDDWKDKKDDWKKDDKKDDWGKKDKYARDSNWKSSSWDNKDKDSWRKDSSGSKRDRSPDVDKRESEDMIERAAKAARGESAQEPESPRNRFTTGSPAVRDSQNASPQGASAESGPSKWDQGPVGQQLPPPGANPEDPGMAAVMQQMAALQALQQQQLLAHQQAQMAQVMEQLAQAKTQPPP